jgi:hypothetical protein
MKLIIALIWIGAVSVVAIILINDFNPSGVRVYRVMAGNGSAAIRPMVPENRVTAQLDGSVIVNAEPVYLDVRVPKIYETATLEMDIQNNNEPLLQAGLAVPGTGEWSFYLQPLQHLQLDKLAWPHLAQRDLTLWQKYPRYRSIDEFLSSSTTNDRIATFNYKLNRPFRIPGYREPDAPLIIERTLRGPMEMAVYVAANSSSTGQLQLSLDIQDINRTLGSDPIAVYVRGADGRNVYSALMSDDGRVSDRVGASPRRQLVIDVPNLAEGAYFIDLRMNEDIFVRKIVSRQHKLIFREHLYVADNAEYSDGFTDMNLAPTVLVTNGRQFSFRTAHPKGYQTIWVNGQPVAKLIERHVEYLATSTTPLATIRAPINDAQIQTDGWLAFSHDQFFNPSVYSVEEFPQLTAFDFLVARYQPAQPTTWRQVSTTFQLKDATRTNGRIRLLISNVKPTGGDGQLRVGSVKVTLRKPSLTKKNMVKQLRNWLASWL